MAQSPEKSPNNVGETLNSPELKEDHKELHETKTNPTEKTHGNTDQIEELQSRAIEKAESTSEHAGNINNAETSASRHPVLINKQLKEMAYIRALTRTRKHLSAPSRLLSRAVHSKALERPTETVGKTIARPSGLLGGALFALLGTSTLLWVTKKYGYEYNYLAVIVLFGIGIISGLIIESLYRAFKRRS